MVYYGFAIYYLKYGLPHLGPCFPRHTRDTNALSPTYECLFLYAGEHFGEHILQGAEGEEDGSGNKGAVPQLVVE